MKNSQAKRLSEELLNVDQKIVADAFEIDDAKKLKEYTKLKTNEAKKPFYIKPVFKRATAIAACLAIVAVTAFTLTKKPDNNITSNSSETSSQNKKVIYVTGEEPDGGLNVEMTKSLKYKYISTALREKMDLYKDYKDVEVVYKVCVDIFRAVEDSNEANRLAAADKEVQSLYEQFLAACEEEQKVWAEYYTFNQANPGNEPEVIEKRKEFIAIINAKESTRKDLFSKKSDKRREIIDNYVKNAKTEDEFSFVF